MTAVGIYRLFASAMIFIIWAAQIVSVSSMFGPEDPIYNASISVPFAERVADEYVSDCLAYAWVRAYDDLHPNDATAIQQNEVRNYFLNCLNTAAARMVSDIGYVSSVQFNGASVVRNDWNHWRASVANVRVDFNFPLATLGYSDSITVHYSISSRKEMNIIPTGYVVIGPNRDQYRIVVRSVDLNMVEVNGLWPR